MKEQSSNRSVFTYCADPAIESERCRCRVPTDRRRPKWVEQTRSSTFSSSATDWFPTSTIRADSTRRTRTRKSKNKLRSKRTRPSRRRGQPPCFTASDITTTRRNILVRPLPTDKLIASSLQAANLPLPRRPTWNDNQNRSWPAPILKMSNRQRRIARHLSRTSWTLSPIWPSSVVAAPVPFVANRWNWLPVWWRVSVYPIIVPAQCVNRWEVPCLVGVFRPLRQRITTRPRRHPRRPRPV